MSNFFFCDVLTNSIILVETYGISFDQIFTKDECTASSTPVDIEIWF